jgi:hypothetical protein
MHNDLIANADGRDTSGRAAIRYVERNPVRAKMVQKAEIILGIAPLAIVQSWQTMC